MIEVPKELTMKVGLVYEAEHFEAIYTKWLNDERFRYYSLIVD